MPTETCILTTEVFTILKALRDRCFWKDSALASILKRKLETALVILRQAVPGNVATLSSEVTFRVDGRERVTRTLSHDRTNFSANLILPISTPRGLALLGLAEGQDFRWADHGGREERVMLAKVQHRPEAERSEMETLAKLSASPQRKPSLKLIRGALYDRPRPVPTEPDDFDDPGPSAA